MESKPKTKSERFYNALLDDPVRANKILIEILEDEKKNNEKTDQNDKNCIKNK